MSLVRKFANDDGNLNTGSILVSQNRKYSDLDVLFTSNSTTKDLYLKKDVASVKQSIKLLLLTHFGERPFQPSIGTEDYLFEPLDIDTAVLLEKSITQTITNYEPRARIDKIHIDAYPSDNRLLVTLFFYIINILELQTLEVTLDRIR